jgi:hypothetical protein
MKKTQKEKKNERQRRLKNSGQKKIIKMETADFVFNSDMISAFLIVTHK